MALPKEPRQKMINIMYLVLTAILALNVSAEILNAFKVVDKSLQNSTTNIGEANKTLYASLQDKMNDEKTKEKASIWKPKADQAQQLANQLDTYINDLKLQLKQAAGLEIKDGKEDFKEDNLDASTRLFETQKKGKEFEDKLKAFKEAILNIDPEIRKKFEKTLPIDVEPPTSQEGGKKDFTTSYFHMTPTVAALTMLSKFQNNVRNAENQVVSFCHEQIGAVKLIYNNFQAIAGANSTYLMPGQEMVVTAGVGAFNDASKPVITIGGAPIGLNANGVAEKKFNVSGSGNQKVHVSITYNKPDGTQDHLEKDIEYTVGIPGGAAVMLDKMNVFYIGVPNPVTIGSPVGWDRTTVSMSGGTISGSGSNRVVTVNSVGTASITVTADGHSNTFSFRVKNIPPPIIKVGPSGGGRMAAAIFRAQPAFRADLENFDFEARYSVVGADIYFNIPGDRNVNKVSVSNGSFGPASAIMSKLVPGSTVTFDNVRVVGPSGQQITILNPPGYSLF